jgi:Zn-dependent M28 family amino/carboxypeptidase
VNGDSIYNGAYDNASGVSLLLEVARAFARLDPAPRRGALFIATTAEEAGLLGARYYVQHPLVPLENTVAELNVDGANLWGETDDVMALGADRSTLGDILQARASEMGLRVRPDPQPEKGSFFRSDHFPFAVAGVPVLFLRHGLAYRDHPAGWGDVMMDQWSRDNYHQPSDEYDPGFDLSGAVQQARLLFSVGYDVADSDARPQWLDGEAIQASGSRP